jgi:hypothetical protein
MAIRHEEKTPVPNLDTPIVEIFSHSILRDAWLFYPQAGHNPVNWNIFPGGHANRLINAMMDMAIQRKAENIRCVFGLHVAQNSISAGMALQGFQQLVNRTRHFHEIHLQGFHSYFWVIISL